MLFAERAILSDFHPLGMILLFLRQVVIPAFAFRARQRDSCTQNFHLAFLSMSQKAAAYLCLTVLSGHTPRGTRFSIRPPIIAPG